jgi:hypothetical protein
VCDFHSRFGGFSGSQKKKSEQPTQLGIRVCDFQDDDVTEEKPVEKEKKLPRLRATLTNTQHRTRGLADTSSDKRVYRDLGTQ